MRRVLPLLCLLLSLSLGALVVDAAPFALENWIPVGSAGVLYVDLSSADTGRALVDVVTRAFPGRLPDGAQADALLPFDLLDAPDARYEAMRAWVSGEVWAVYSIEGERLLMLGVRDPFRAAAALRDLLDAQDRVAQSSHRAQTLFQGDRATFAITPEALLIGDELLVKLALDRRAGEGATLAGEGIYADLRGRLLSGERAAFGWLRGLPLPDGQRTTFAALNAALGGGGRGALIQETFWTLLMQVSAAPDTLAATLVTADAVGFGASLTAGGLDVTFEGAWRDDVTFSAAAPDAALRDYLPSETAFALSGSDGRFLADALLVGLPLARFLPEALGALVPGQAPTRAPQATLANVGNGMAVLYDTLQRTADLNLRDDLLAHAGGSFVLALVPRAAGVSFFGTRWDALLVLKSEGAADALAALEKLVRAVWNLPELTTSGGTISGGTTSGGTTSGGTTSGGMRVATAPNGATLRLLADGDLLLVASGDLLDAAQRAQAGDNRLALDALPLLYVDTARAYPVLFGVTGGAVGAAGAGLRVTVLPAVLDDGRFVRFDAQVRAQ